MSRLVARAERWLFGPEAGGRLRLVQAGFALVIVARLALGPHRQLAGQPPALFRPPLLLSWLDAIPQAEVLVLVQVVGVAAGVAVIAGRWTRLAFPLAWAALLFLDALLASRGKFMHNDVLLLLAAVPMLAAPRGSRWFDQRPSVRFGWPVRSAMVVIAGAYTFSGVAKLVTSGPAWVTSDNLRYVLAAGARSDRPPTHAIAEFVVARPGLAHLVAFGALALELCFVLILFAPRLRPWFAVAAAGLHASIWLTLGLDYWSWVAVDLIVLVDWNRRVPGWAGRLAPGRWIVSRAPPAA